MHNVLQTSRPNDTFNFKFRAPNPEPEQKIHKIFASVMQPAIQAAERTYLNNLKNQFSPTLSQESQIQKIHTPIPSSLTLEPIEYKKILNRLQAPLSSLIAFNLNQINFCTYNLGQGIHDFSFMLHDQRTELAKRIENLWPPELREIKQKQRLNSEERKLLETAEKNSLVELEEDAEKSAAYRLLDRDIICLQEVMTLNRPFIQILQEHGYAILSITPDQATDRFSTAVAVKTDRFSEIKNISIITEENSPYVYGKEVAAVIVQPHGSSVKLAFSSLHSIGFRLFPPNQRQDLHHLHEEKDKKAQADVYVSKAIQHIPYVDHSILTGDINNNPENYQPTFDFFRTRNYEILRSDKATNINPADSEYQEREIDFIFSKTMTYLQSFWKALQSVFISTASFRASKPTLAPGFAFTIEGNCSDHMPLNSTLQITTTPSLLSRIKAFFSNPRKRGPAK
ncbi:MAG: hypothetical protein Q8L98_07470 [Chlamydiales bacterium]|nr:hypothetical protein [Chlamydiales bacterium]